MEADLNISLNGFQSEDDANKVGHLALEIIRTLEKRENLNISKLKSILISYDFQSALDSIASKFNYKSDVTYTNTNQAQAVGKVLSNIGNNGTYSEHAIILDVNFFAGYILADFSLEAEFISPIIHKLHHELVHIHERNILKNLDVSMSVGGYDDALLMLATSAWSEYLANYMSSSTATKNCIDGTLLTFESALKEVPDELIDLIYKYQTGQVELGDMFQTVKSGISLLCNLCAYSFGYIHGIKIDTKKHYPSLHELLDKTDLSQILLPLAEALDSLTGRLSNDGIGNYRDFDSVQQCIENVYLYFGLRLERTGENKLDLYVHVG
ncbi:hypothetical protein A9Q75_01540 [Colwellia psychrerythraea]|uniref:Uncharacterized protein n=1 Tax=Colwellia psychrerythraea TaxID=28229 RepID=A0A1Y5EPU8_COLPS|nr:hypothetical protein A9Q75_01540 [Colwellia psychrerythraea]